MTPLEIKTPLLAMCQELCIAEFRIAQSGVMSQDSGKLASFSNAIIKLVGESLHGAAPVKRVNEVRKRWGALSLTARMMVVDLSEEQGCKQQLSNVVGELPDPEPEPACASYEPMF
jgi:hypothetical protein